MKTKKLIWVAILIVSLGTFTTGCGKENDNKETVELQIIEENQLNEASQGLYEEFTKILETKEPVEVKKFMLDNIEDVTEETVNKMVLEYEMLLSSNYEEIIDTYNSLEYFNAVNETMDENYKLNLENVKDEKIKQEVMTSIEAGYTFVMMEGSYYLTIDYGMIQDTFNEYLSDSIKPYYELRKKELNKPTFVEEYVSIDFDEIKNRARTLENVIRDHKEFANRVDVQDWMKVYIEALLRVDYFSGAVDYKTGQVKEEIKEIYRELEKSDLKISKYAAEKMNELLTEYDYVLKPEDEKAYEKVVQLRFELVGKVGEQIVEYYSQQES